MDETFSYIFVLSFSQKTKHICIYFTEDS